MNQEFISKIKTFEFQTKERLQFITITKEIQDFVEQSEVEQGTLTIQTHHTTCGIWINEDEKNLIGPENTLGHKPDLKRVLDRFAGPDEHYGHDDICDAQNPNGKRNTHLCEADSCGIIPECRNGHAHAQAMILNPSLNLIIKDGKLLKGRWQEIMLIELDHDRPRKVTILAQGVKKTN